ncbi:uncharacterized protein CEXT_446211 [Caerostris extrusa]|uniref:Uncharacterized protein n=1 Tax=Caerostris extrusa TaxID=172846 RepID=A0AAV4PKU4_CAEEX|nr:uncharacterized protein CEXT_446211 [Caerostris extrusa]
MANVVIPFLMSMLLGRTIDLTTYSVGGDIYDHKDYDESPLNVLNSTYTVLQENVLPYSHIGLPADLVLRIKSDYIHSSSGTLGLDGLLKETSWKSSSVVIAVTSMFQTVYRELKSNSPFSPTGWNGSIQTKLTTLIRWCTVDGAPSSTDSGARCPARKRPSGRSSRRRWE